MDLIVCPVIYAVLAACGLWLIWAKGKKRREKAGYGLVLLGMAILNTSALYHVRIYRASPQSPDASHTIMWMSGGHRRYVLPSQENLYRRVNLVGWPILVIGGGLLFPWGKRNPRDANR